MKVDIISQDKGRNSIDPSFLTKLQLQAKQQQFQGQNLFKLILCHGTIFETTDILHEVCFTFKYDINEK